MNPIIIALLLFLFRLDTLWATSNFSSMDFVLSKATLTQYVHDIEGFPKALGITDRVLPITAEFQLLPGPDNDGRWLGGTYTDPELPAGYVQRLEAFRRGKPSRGCTQHIILNGRLRYAHNPFFGTPLWMGTVAHESIHVSQGILCISSNTEVETMAELGSWLLLAAHADTWEQQTSAIFSEAALIYDLRHRSIQAVLDLYYQAEKEPKFLEYLHLTEAEYLYYKELSPAWLAAHRAYWTDSIILLLTEAQDDGIIQTNYLPSGVLDIQKLLEFLREESIIYGY